ncbi:MAG: beta-ketoacyl synthase [Parahaliea sp.]
MTKMRLPVVVGMGGINAAGRTSGHHAYRRLVLDALSERERRQTLASLASLMSIPDLDKAYICEHTLIRRIESHHFDVDRVVWNRRFRVESNGQPVTLDIKRQFLPEILPLGWDAIPISSSHARVSFRGVHDFLLPAAREFEVKAAGQLPTGFEPGKLYPSRSHPRGLEMMVYAASDALGSVGIDWEQIRSHVGADEISVYAGSAMGQLDKAGAGGMMKSRYNGQRVSSKYCPFSLAEMPADFVNAYVLGSLGSTGAVLGACASFLYNLRLAINDIRSGRARVVFVGSSEAPINPEVMEGYAAMGALATDKELRELDDLPANSAPDYRRACRPFAPNCGFTIAESAQMVVLFDDALMMELGATPLASIVDVLVNADGYKKSISGPGVGNYITVAKALAEVRHIIGKRMLREGGLVQAHGTGTPQNRITESRILNETAKAFGIERWPVAAIKCYLGHSLGSASGDQVTNTLGIWQHGIVPGIATIDCIADDVQASRLVLDRRHRELDPTRLHYALINAKGFGGNNATASMLSPTITCRMLQARYPAADWQRWQSANDVVRERQADYDSAMTAGEIAPVYRFDNGVLGDDDVVMNEEGIEVGRHHIRFDSRKLYEDLKLSD